MIRRKKLLLLIALSFCLFGCADEGSEIMISFEQLDGNTFLFIVDRELEQTDVGTQGMLDESEYIPIENGNEYSVIFSDDGQSITINPGELSGTLQTEENDMKSFLIEDDFFAGGRFLVWIEYNTFQAELTEYGSGVPIIASERGDLILSE